jgi:hypothetical protein
MVTYMSPLGGTCTRASQEGLICSCSMYTNPTNVLEESAESILSFEADTENISCIGSLTSLIPSQAPFLSGKELVLCLIQLLYLHILGYWLSNKIQHMYCTNRALASVPTWAILLFLSLAMYMVT